MFRPRGLGFACVVVVASLAAAPVWADDSWVGKLVMPKRFGLTIGHTDKESQQEIVDATLHETRYKVEQEKGEFIKVRQRGVSGWLAKADVVRFEDAVDYCTDRIQENPNDANAYLCRADAWRWKGETDIAIKDFSEAIRLDPKSAQLSFWPRPSLDRQEGIRQSHRRLRRSDQARP